LAYVFDNYASGHVCPDLPVLQRKLNAVGFGSCEIRHALLWLEDLKSAARCIPSARALSVNTELSQVDTNDLSSQVPSPPTTTRIFTSSEQNHLGIASWGYLVFLESIGVLSSQRLELVMDSVMTTPVGPIQPDDLKLIVLLVFWSLNEDPGSLLTYELCGNLTPQFVN
jgi:Smg protein